MSSYKEQLSEILKRHDQSLTKPRLLMFEALQNQDPQTIKQIIDSLVDDVDRASIYRTVALFEKLGIIHRIQIGWKHKFELSDEFHIHHHHLTCLYCGTVITLHEDNEIEKRLEYLTNIQEFQMQSHQLEIQGSCIDCTKKTRE